MIKYVLGYAARDYFTDETQFWEWLSDNNKFDSYLPFKTDKKMKLKVYIQEAYDELVHKVTWPTWKELQSSALVVMVASLIISLIIFLMDFSFENVMEFIYGLLY